jgi:prepilin-type N-terminal cleavage/methylation domain-containing protein
VAAPIRRDDGFTLIEVLVAITLLATAAAGVGGLVTLAALSVRDARAHTWATLLAAGKMEHLRSLGWSELATSPPESLAVDTAGFVEYLDAKGQETGSGAVYVRRWSIQPAPVDSMNSRLLQVRVMPASQPRGVSVVITSLRTRKDL